MVVAGKEVLVFDSGISESGSEITGRDVERMWCSMTEMKN